MLILCNSHNPVGRVWTREELARIGELCCRYDVLILSDEIHADLALFGHRHTVMASVSEEIAARTLTAMAPSKTFNIAGMMNSVIIASNPEILEVYNRELTTLHLDLGNIFGHVTLKAAYRYGGRLVGGTDPVSGRECTVRFGLFRERTTTDQSIETRRFVFIVAGFPGDRFVA